jgi:hypothetical protein
MAAGDAFAAAMSSGTLAAFEPLSDVPVSNPEWKPIRELIETSNCINVHSHRTTIDKHDDRGATIIVDVDTARGRDGAGEGLIGMSWALQVAGCPTAIVSQWKAASAPTARLMIAFHRHLLTGASKSESLRRASMELMRTPKYAHPFYWAPFVLVGAP